MQRLFDVIRVDLGPALPDNCKLPQSSAPGLLPGTKRRLTQPTVTMRRKDARELSCAQALDTQTMGQRTV